MAFTQWFQLLFNKRGYYQPQITQINALFAKVMHSQRFGVFNHQLVRALTTAINELKLPVHVLQLGADYQPNILGVRPEKTRKYQSELTHLLKEKRAFAAQQLYESAAKTRDKEKDMCHQFLQAICVELELNNTFNFYQNKLVVVMPKDAAAKSAVNHVLKRMRTES